MRNDNVAAFMRGFLGYTFLLTLLIAWAVIGYAVAVIVFRYAFEIELPTPFHQ
jgi:mannose/fructose/N-acetylgalactosamine-specific phosphotransferase system component IIC